MFTSKDRQLTTLAHQANLLDLRGENNALALAGWRRIYMTVGHFKKCSKITANRQWFVKLFLGGEQRLIGILGHGFAAVRFADAAIEHFWKYRSSPRPITDNDLNFGVESVKLDHSLCPGLKELLVEIENHLLQTGKLKQEQPKKQMTEEDFYWARQQAVSRWYKAVQAFETAFQRIETFPAAQPFLQTARDQINQLNKVAESFLKLNLEIINPTNQTTNTP